ncbi:hypothetical protein ES705_34021 [subsurface metagenome]
MNEKKRKTEVTKIENQDREIIVGRNRLYLGEDNIIYITNVGDIDEKLAIEITASVKKLASMVEGKVDRITDLNKAGKPSSGARKIFKELSEDEKCGKVTFFGLHPVARVLASFFMGITRKKDIHYFKTKEEALKWLKE